MTGVDDRQAKEGLRERKRRETEKRIVDAALRLFVANGYDGTTIDEIADEAAISRRTFFHYFKSKDDILPSMQSGMGDMLAAAMWEEPDGRPPLAAMRDAVVKLSALYPAEDIVAIDRLMRSNETVMARKQASYIQHEATLFAALCKRWPEPSRRTEMQLVAMITIGVIRLSLEAISHEDGRRPVIDILHETFDALERVT